MKKLLFFTLLVGISFLSTAFVYLNTNWLIEKEYNIAFTGTNATGTFKGLKGYIVFDPNNLATANMNISVDASTINTGSDGKDKHAKNESWFDVTKYPTINFESISFLKEPKGYRVIGNLTLHGITKTIAIPFQFSTDNKKGLFEGNFKINRKDYGINGNSFGFVVGKEYDIKLRIPVVK